MSTFESEDYIKVTVWLMDGTKDEFYADEYCESNDVSVTWYSSQKDEYYTYPYAYIKKFVETDTEPE